MTSCRASIFIATSEDGFIADSEGSVDWLNALNATMPEGEDGGFNVFMASVDALVMGRKTFESVLELVPKWGWAYGDTPVVVLSSAPHKVLVPEALSSKVTAMCGTPAEVLAALEHDIGAKDVYVDGGTTLRRFLAAGLVHRAIITTVPAVLGSGVALFPSADQRASLEQVGEPTRWANGFVQTTYRVEHQHQHQHQHQQQSSSSSSASSSAL